MAVASVSRLNPRAPPFNPVALVPAQFHHAPTPAAMPTSDFLAPQCLYPPPPPPPPPVFGWAVACGGGGGGCWCRSGGFASTICTCAQLFREAATPAAWVHPPPPPRPVAVYYCTVPQQSPPSTTRCRITEIGQDGSEGAAKEEVGDDPSPRSVLTTWSRKLPTAPLPQRAAVPPPPTSYGAKARRCQWPRLAFDPNTNNTSLMIRNIPNKFMKRRFMTILDQHCAEENAKLGGDGAVVKSEYDFLYVPVDFRTKCNKGYAFVNMTTAAAARRLHAHLHGHRWAAASSRKVCDVVHARVEGLDALVAHFSGSRFPCGGAEEFLPVRFEPPRDGVRPTAEHVVGCLLDHPR